MAAEQYHLVPDLPINGVPTCVVLRMEKGGKMSVAGVILKIDEGWYINEELCEKECISRPHGYHSPFEAMADLNWEDQ